MSARRAAALRWLQRLRPRRTIWPTRDGWWCLFAAFGLGVAAINTRNNLLYLLVSMLLGLIIVSGMLSEQSMRKLGLSAVLPEEIYAGTPVLLGATLVNRKRRRASYSITLEVLADAGRRLLYVPRLAAGEERLLTWETTLPARGRQRLRGARIVTRFPFGLFAKAGRIALDVEVVVFPAIHPVPSAVRRRVAAEGAAARRRGRGHDLYNLRDYRAGDDPRLIHWRSSAKTQSLLVRELEADTAVDVHIVLDGTGRRNTERRERALSEAASLAVHFLRAGGAVGVTGPGVFVPLGRGTAHARRVLTALALYEPDRRPAVAPSGVGRFPTGAGERGPHGRSEIRVGLD